MIFVDWLIVFIVLAVMIFSVNLSKGLMKSVTDFLSAGRTAGRYLIAVSSGIAGLGAISVVMFLEMGYVAGFSLAWWGLSQGIIILMLTMSGWVIYRFRSTRCLTLAQFFEKRYSRRFRIFTGIVAQLPVALSTTFELGRTGALSTIFIVFLLVMSVSVIAFMVFIERAQRRITVQ